MESICLVSMEIKNVESSKERPLMCKDRQEGETHGFRICWCRSIYRCPFCNYYADNDYGLKDHLNSKRHRKQLLIRMTQEYIEDLVKKSQYTKRSLRT